MSKPTSFRLSDMTSQQLDWLVSRTGLTQTSIVTTAIDRMYQQEQTMTINICERYGEPVPATIEDYEELNPESTFMYDDEGQIVELDMDGGEVVAIPAKAYEQTFSNSR